MSVLSTLKILDFSTLLPGPFATMYLADLGADVVRVEAPNRFDMVRSRPPFDDGVAAGHAFLNRSKRSIGINLKTTQGIEIVKRLIQTYDIVLEQFRPGVMKRLGLDYETLAEINPRLIYCSLTGYGQTGPLRDRAGHDNNYLALAGLMSHSGTREHGPKAQGYQVADIGAGSMGVVAGILAATIHRHETGEGQFVDVSMFDGAVLWNAYAGAAYLVSGDAPTYQSLPLNGGSHYGYYRTKDHRYLSIGSLEPQFWKQFCQTLNRPDLIERLTQPGPEMDTLIQEIRTIIATKTMDQWTKIFAQADCCVEPVLTLQETLDHPHTQARNLLVQVPKPNGKTQQQIGHPLKFSKSQPTYKHTGPTLGAHNQEVLTQAGYTNQEIQTLESNNVLGTGKDG